MAIFRPYLCWELFVVLSLADYSLVPQMWRGGGGGRGDTCRSERAICDLLAMSEQSL